ncbi:MAG: hypothetical protein AB2792_13635 [Candidatus Thiodiazotropha sp.]
MNGKQVKWPLFSRNRQFIRPAAVSTAHLAPLHIAGSAMLNEKVPAEPI